MAFAKTKVVVAVGALIVVVATAVVLLRSDDDGRTSSSEFLHTAMPAHEGSYRVSVKTTRTAPRGEPEERTSMGTMTIRTTSRPGGDVRQAVTTGEDSSEVVWRAEGQFVLSDNVEDVTGRCNWHPPILAYRFPLREEAAWRVASTCTAGNITVQRAEKTRVTGRQSVKIGKDRVAAWVVERAGKVTYTATPGGERLLALDTTVVDFFAPAHGVAVRSTTTRTMTTAGGGTLESSTETELVELRPR